MAPVWSLWGERGPLSPRPPRVQTIASEMQKEREARDGAVLPGQMSPKRKAAQDKAAANSA